MCAHTPSRMFLGAVCVRGVLQSQTHLLQTQQALHHNETQSSPNQERFRGKCFCACACKTKATEELRMGLWNAVIKMYFTAKVVTLCPPCFNFKIKVLSCGTSQDQNKMIKLLTFYEFNGLDMAFVY